MQVQLSKPRLQKFIADQVKAGHYPSVDAAIEAAVEQMMVLEGGELDDRAVAAIERADAQYDSGQFVEWGEVRDDLRKKYLGK